MLFEVIRRARRRLLFNTIATMSARALNGYLIVLLLIAIAGSDALDWGWAAFPPLAILAAGVWSLRRSFPSPYRTAQIVDRRLGLSDVLSTAVYFFTGPAAPCDGGIRQAQYEAASHLAADLSPVQAVPLRMPRAAHWSALFAALAASLLTMRYSVQGHLDLHAPLTPGIQRLAVLVKEELQAVQKAISSGLEELSKQQDASAKPQPKPADTAKGSGDTSSTTAAMQQGQQQEQGSASDRMAGDEAGEEGQSANSNSARESNSDSQNGSPDTQNSSSENRQQGAPSSGESSSVLSKLSNSVSNLLSALKPRSGQGKDAGDPSRNNSQTGRNGKQQSSGKGQDAQGSDSSDSAQGSDPSQGDGNKSASAGRNADGESGKQPGSGAGRDDGEKAIRAAEQRAAMGKISQILGRRSENLTGSAAVEVLSGQQELTTRYEQRKVDHREVEAKAERDEVPLELQDFVNQYFQKLRASGAQPKSSQKK